MNLLWVRFCVGGLLTAGSSAVSARGQSNAVYAIEFNISNKLKYRANQPLFI